MLKKISGVTLSWILRGIGFLILLPVVYPPPFLRLFPGLEDPRAMRILLWLGMLVFMSGAALYFILRSIKGKKQRDELDDVIDEKDSDSKH